MTHKILDVHSEHSIEPRINLIFGSSAIQGRDGNHFLFFLPTAFAWVRIYRLVLPKDFDPQKFSSQLTIQY